MSEQYLKDEFLKTYNSCSDDIFAFCYRETAERDIAKYLTRNVFMATWDQVATSGKKIGNLSKLLKRNAREHTAQFLSGRHSQTRFRDNLWNLTLSQ